MQVTVQGRLGRDVPGPTLHHNIKIGDGRSNAKSGYSDIQYDAKKL